MALAGWNTENRYKLVIDGSKIDGDLTDFPINITLSSGTGIGGVDTTFVFDELNTTYSGIDSNTKLLLHMRGDASISGTHAITTNGNTQVTSQAPPGFSRSTYFDENSYLSIASHPDFNYSGDFTIDFWVYPESTGTSRYVINQNTRQPAIAFTNTGVIGTTLDNGTWIDTAAGVISDGSWQHVAYVRESNNVTIYVDGINVKTGTDSTNVAAGTIIIGDYSTYEYKGYISEFRISNGVARWSSNFTPPTEPYSTISGVDTYTKFLLHPEGDTTASGHQVSFNGGTIMATGVGKFNGSYKFDGTGDYITIPDNTDFIFGADAFTIDFWINFSDTTNCYLVTDYPSPETQDGSYAFRYWDGDLDLWTHSGGAAKLNYPWTPTTGIWYHIALICDGTTLSMYIDGTVVDSTSAVLLGFSGKDLDIAGNSNALGNELNGYIDEFRISKGVARWIENFNPPTSPYPINEVVSYTPQKIAVTTAADEQLYVEIENWNPYKEEAYLWVKVPTMSSGIDTTLYLYFDSTHTINSGYVGETGSIPAQNVWNNNFTSVFHMSQDPAGGSGSILDSTSSGNDGTPSGSMTVFDLIDGKINGAIDFDGSDDYIDIPTDASFNFGGGDFMISMWLNFSSLSGDIVKGLFSAQTGTDSYQFLYRISGYGIDNCLHVWSDDQTSFQSDTWTPDLNTWYYITFARDGNTLRYFVDGVAKGTSDITGKTFNTNGNDVGLASATGESAVVPFYGGIDEVRTIKISYAAAWIGASYYNELNSFVTFSYSPFSEEFTFSNPIPIHLSTAYGTSEQLRLTVTVTGTYPSYAYNATFYDESDDSQIGTTASGVSSGDFVTKTMSTLEGVDYSWYVTATSSGTSDTSTTYTFSNRFLCAGYTEDGGVRTSGIAVRLYRRSTGVLEGATTSTGVNATFEIDSRYDEQHYAIALHPDSDTNALIFDGITP